MRTALTLLGLICAFRLGVSYARADEAMREYDRAMNRLLDSIPGSQKLDSRSQEQRERRWVP